jgi:hypothetical protein
MKVSTTDQIGQALPAQTRAYGARAKASDQQMNIPGDVPERPGTDGKNNRQDLPVESQKDNGSEHRRPAMPPAGLMQALEKLAQKGSERPEAKGLAVANERIQSNIDRYMAQAAVPAPNAPSVNTTA